MTDTAKPARRSRPLFRQEALDFQQHRHWGELVMLQPVPVVVTFWGLMAALAAIVAYLVLADYARKESVKGFLTPTAGVSKVFAPRSGTISAVHIEEGSLVDQGDPLFTVSVDQTTSGGENVDKAVLDALGRQRDLLATQVTAQQASRRREERRLTAEARGIGDEILLLRDQIATQEERLKLAEDRLASAETLHRDGYLAAGDLKQRQEEFLAGKQALDALRQQGIVRENALAAVRHALERLPAETAEKTQELNSRLLDIEQRIAETDGRRAYVVRAAVSGRISTLQAVVGRSVDPQHLQLSVLPENSVLQAELFVPTRAVGFVRVGQPVRIRYDAFPYQQFGAHSGEVVKVTQTILTGTDIAIPVALQEPAYKVTVTLDQQGIDAYGQKVPLQADMLLEADIILERRSLFRWLLNPLLSAGRRL